MTTTHRPLWQSDNGAVCCENHLGMSASSELAANPKAKRLYTGPDSWSRMTKAEITDWLEFLSTYNHTEPCEYCREGIY